MKLPQSTSLFSPAKLNLSLFVYSPLPNGYHPIFSVFQLISLGDILDIDFTSTPSFHLEVSGEAIDFESNILTCIYRRFSDRIPFGISIFLTKRIPVGGGLGGGSANAAVFLKLLNETCLGLSEPELIKVALEFGSDIPFFLIGGTAAVSGVGETLEPLPAPPFEGYILIVPPLSISTQEIYRATDEFGWVDACNPTLELSTKTRYLGPNTLQRAVWKLYPEYSEITAILTRHELPSPRLSGSGATLFIPYHSYERADRDYTKIRTLLPDCKMYLVINCDS